MNINFFNLRSFISLLLLLLMASCGQPSATVENSQPANVQETSSSNLEAKSSADDAQQPSANLKERSPSDGAKKQAANLPEKLSADSTQKPPKNQAVSKISNSPKIKSGAYCFEIESKTLSSSIQLTIEPDNRVTGSTEATIHNEQAGYYSSYTQTFAGTLKENSLELAITTKIENDTQNSQETWILTGDSLNTGRETYQKVDCSTSTQPTSAPIRVQFARGTTKSVIENSVERGNRHTYLLGAKAGQNMTVSITAVEDNAVFDIIAPNRATIEQEKTSASVTLPTTGDYSIIVSGTRGNATYKLEVEIE